MTPDREEIITCHGVKIPLDRRIITPRIERRLRDQKYEKDEILRLPKFLKSSDKILELGGGLGILSSFAVMELGIKDFHCIEANPRVCAFIRRVHEANGITNVAVTNAVAVSGLDNVSPDGTLPFYVAEPFWSSSTIRRDNITSTEVKVAAIPLNELIAQQKPTAIICDIEGGEIEIFENAELGNLRFVLIELHARVYGGRGVRKVFDDLHSRDLIYNPRISGDGIALFKRLRRR